jgi:Ca-activated chloride channel homolog
MAPTLIFFGLFLGISAAFLWLRRRQPHAKTGMALWLIALLCAAILSTFTTQFQGQSRLRIFVIDGSASFERAHEIIRKNLKEASLDLGSKDRCALIIFGNPAKTRVAIPPGPPASFQYQSLDWLATAGGSHLEQGLNAALALSSEGRSREIVFMSDGLQTHGSFARACLNARAQGVKVFTYCPPLAPVRDLSVGPIATPGASPVNKRVRFDVPVSSSINGEVSAILEIRAFRGNSSQIQWERRSQVYFPFAQRLVRSFEYAFQKPGLYRIEASIYPRFSGESFEQNNRQKTWLRVGVKQSALILGSDASYAPSLLKSAGFDSVFLSIPTADATQFKDALQSSPSLIVIDDQPFAALRPFIADIDRSISDHGVGLLLFGGPHAFGPGGYAESALETILPVRSDPPSDPGQALSLIAAVDSSGSMKDHYQDALEFGLERATSLIRNGDQLSLYAFADGLRLRRPKLSQSEYGQALVEFRELEARDGTNLILPLQAILEELLTAPKENKKLGLLVTDARAQVSPEQLSGLQGLARKLAATNPQGGVRLVFLLIGDSESMVLLQSLAKSLSSQTVQCTAIKISNAKESLKKAVEGSVAFVREEVAHGQFRVQLSPPFAKALKVSSILGSLSAYNRVRPKPASEVLGTVSSRDEALVAKGLYGRGRVAVYSSSLGEWSEALLRGKAGRDLVAQLPDLVASRVDEQWSLRATRVGSRVKVTAQHRNFLKVSKAQITVSLSTPDQRPRRFSLIPSSPGVQQRVVKAPETTFTLSAHADKPAQNIGVIAVSGLEADEFQTLDADNDLLGRMAKITGGRLLSVLPRTAHDLQRLDDQQIGLKRSLGPLFSILLIFVLLWLVAGEPIGKLAGWNLFSNN